jgi:hypothetical protein
MPGMKLLVVSDLHFAGPQEQTRRGHEARVMPNAVARGFAHLWRHHCWLRDPFAHNDKLGRIIAANPAPDLVVANGDFTIDSGYVGVSDDAALESAALALGELRSAYGDRLLATIGDHDLGKKSLFGGAGGPRWESLLRCERELGLSRFWRREFGHYVLFGFASTPLAWPVFEAEGLPVESAHWREAQANLQARITLEFARLPAHARVLLFVHDPTALRFLWDLPEVRTRLHQVERTIIGHIHTPAIWRVARLLAGMPRLNFFGVTARRLSTALNSAGCWKHFRIALCPAPTGCQALKDGGWLTLELPQDQRPPLIIRHRLPW